jgi:hypothetical protein
MTRNFAVLLIAAAAAGATAPAGAAAAAPAAGVIVDFNATQVRVQALSRTLVRVEPLGPRGFFEDRATFGVVGRAAFDTIALHLLNQSGADAWVGNDDVSVHLALRSNGPAPGPGACLPVAVGSDVLDPSRSKNYPNGAVANDRGDCCSKCEQDADCTAWVFAGTSETAEEDTNCWLLNSFSGFQPSSQREVGCGDATCAGAVSPLDTLEVFLADGTLAWSSANNGKNTDDDDNAAPLNYVSWPAPGAGKIGYAFEDSPRFYAPPWGPTPIPSGAKVDPKLVPTNGYDFTNNVKGDTYIFLFPNTGTSADAAAAATTTTTTDLSAWHASRRDFLTLTGPIPLLPDYAYGTWFTYWHQYSEDEAKGEVQRWNDDKLPIDLWALDMNWRNSPYGHDGNFQKGDEHYYNHPNTGLFPDFANNGTGWFDFLQSKGLRTYFNDHPFPADLGKAYQTTADEVNFRHDGLTHWMDKGLTFWWFDANWGFSIPPPQVSYPGSGDGPSWQGMDNRVWGSHVYYESIAVYDSQHPERKHTVAASRPMSLTKYADDNMVPGLVQHQHPAHHRFPVWWTGDGVILQASVQSMVDSGVYDFKPFVHSDCGGDYRGQVGGDLLRWTAHCVFGTILRFHGGQHQPWSYDGGTEDTIRSYLQMRYKIIPSLVAAGATASTTGFPIVARCDLFWPDHEEATSNEQYLHLNDTLVAPIWDSSQSATTRSVWIPPGQWQDAWDGSQVTGPKTMSVTQPYERIPMWHRVGGMMVTTGPRDNQTLRVDDQDWSELTLEAFVPGQLLEGGDAPRLGTQVVEGEELLAKKLIVPQDRDGARGVATVTMVRRGNKTVVRVTEDESAADGLGRTYHVRFHLRKGQRVVEAAVDGKTLSAGRGLALHAPLLMESSEESTPAAAFFPFLGPGTRPAPWAGVVAEVRMRGEATIVVA